MSSLAFIILLTLLALHACESRPLFRPSHSNKDLETHTVLAPEETPKQVVGEGDQFMQAANIHGRGGAVAGGRGKSLVKVPWRVPHERNQEMPELIGVDYAEPRTHPSSHNRKI